MKDALLEIIGDQSQPPALGETSKYAQPTIVIGRHGKPALSRKIYLTSHEYKLWWQKYDEGTIVPNQKVPRNLISAVARVAKIMASPLPRAYDTAKAVAGGREIIKDELFVEAPLPPPPLPDFVRFRPRSWGFIARCTWFVGFSGGQESHDDAKIRAAKAAQKLAQIADVDGSVAVLAHGWFNRMMRPHLKNLGYVCIYDGGDWHWSYRVYRKA